MQPRILRLIAHKSKAALMRLCVVSVGVLFDLTGFNVTGLPAFDGEGFSLSDAFSVWWRLCALTCVYGLFLALGLCSVVVVVVVPLLSVAPVWVSLALPLALFVFLWPLFWLSLWVAFRPLMPCDYWVESHWHPRVLVTSGTTYPVDLSARIYGFANVALIEDCLSHHRHQQMLFSRHVAFLFKLKGHFKSLHFPVQFFRAALVVKWCTFVNFLADGWDQHCTRFNLERVLAVLVVVFNVLVFSPPVPAVLLALILVLANLALLAYSVVLFDQWDAENGLFTLGMAFDKVCDLPAAEGDFAGLADLVARVVLHPMLQCYLVTPRENFLSGMSAVFLPGFLIEQNWVLRP